MSAASASARAAFALRDRFASPARRLWPWLPALFALAYAILLLGSLRSTVQAIYWNADSSSALTIGQLLSDRVPGDEVTLGNFPWYSTLWFEDLTRGLPAHREIWQISPWLVSLLGVGMVAWSTALAAGRWAATMAGIALACAGPGLLFYQFSWSIHAWTFFHVCLLGFFLVLWAARDGRLGGWPLHVAACAVLAAVTAAGVASDKLLVPAGVAPFLLAGLALAVMLPRPAGPRIGVGALAVSVVSLVGGRFIAHAMEADGVRAFRFDIAFAQWDRIAPNVRLSAQSLAYLFNGDFNGARLSAQSSLTFLCAVAILTGLVAGARFVRRWVQGVHGAAVERSRRELAAHPARTAHIAFWGLAGAIVLSAFILSAVPVDRYTARYIVTVGYAIAALVPVAAVARGTWARAAVVAGLCIVLTGSLAALVRRDLQDNPARFPTPALSGPLVRLAQQLGLKYGYAGYWEASPLTWQARGAIKVYPVSPCQGPPSKLCPFRFHRISSWYVPRPGTRSFLLSDPTQPDGAFTPTAALGRPQLVRKIGQSVVYVYDYDIASRFGP